LYRFPGLHIDLHAGTGEARTCGAAYLEAPAVEWKGLQLTLQEPCIHASVNEGSEHHVAANPTEAIEVSNPVANRTRRHQSNWPFWNCQSHSSASPTRNSEPLTTVTASEPWVAHA